MYVEQRFKLSHVTKVSGKHIQGASEEVLSREKPYILFLNFYLHQESCALSWATQIKLKKILL